MGSEGAFGGRGSVRFVRGIGGVGGAGRWSCSGIDLGVTSVFDRLRTLASAFVCISGDDVCLSLRCLFDGIPRADARLLAIDELISRGGRCAGNELCCWER